MIKQGTGMFDYEPAKEKTSADWSGTLIGLILLPVLFFFIYIGKAELGFTACIALAMSMIAVKFRWKLRKHAWFWATIVVILALHVPLLFVIRWPHTNVPTIAYSLPLGLVDFALITGGINLAQKLFSKGEDEENQGGDPGDPGQ